MIPKFNETDYIDELINPLYEIMQEVNYKTISVISNRINKIGKMSATDAQRLSQVIRMQDLTEIQAEIAKGTKRALKEIDVIIESAAAKNDQLSENLYAYRNMEPSNFKFDKRLSVIVEQAKKSIKDNVLNLSKNSVMRMVVNGKSVKIKDAYNYSVNRAIFEVQQGIFDYNTAIRSVIKDLSKNGLETVEYESGLKRRLDSAVRNNVLSGVGLMNQSYRLEQSNQYGGNHVFVSFHGMPATDHQIINGSDYTLKQWEIVSGGLERQVGMNNCRHSLSYGITGVSENPYSKKEREDAIKTSNKPVKYTGQKKDVNGNYITKETTKYKASQILRKIETDIRRLKDQRNQLDKLNDKIEISELNKQIKSKTVYYKQVSEQVGLKTQMERLRVYTPK